MSNFNNGGKLPPGLDYFHNLLSPPGPFMRLLKHKRQPYIKLRMEHDGVFVGFWKWKCQKCSNTWGTSGIWEYAINAAHTHAIMKHELPHHATSRPPTSI